MKPFERLLLENKAWAQEKVAQDPDYFARLANIQKPDFLWIGCSDSRVPANEITNTQPGEIFVHRNIANVVNTTDINLLSVLQYAVDVLTVKHIVVCGHYGCGGIQAALSKQQPELVIVNKWLKHIKDVYRLNCQELDRCQSEKDKVNRLVELNTIEQVHNLSRTSIIQKAWKMDRALDLHGWVYAVQDGMLRELITLDANCPIDPIYQYDFE
jgi:carbonic anhydrase